MSKDETLRHPDGRWKKGTPPPNPAGRPRREVEAEYLDVTIASVSKEDWATVVRSMISRAKAGDVAAARWLADYMLGKPTERLNVTSEDDSAVTVLRLPGKMNEDGAAGSERFDALAEIDRQTVEAAKLRSKK